VQITKVAARTGTLVSSLILASLLSACGSGGETDTAAAVGAPIGGGYAAPEVATPQMPGSPAPASSTAAAAPTISGSPLTATRIGVAYSFQPASADANGDALSFAISGKPAWASFETATGKLTGTPGAGDLGSFNNVSITVSDGRLTASLAPFSILVSAGSSGSATLSWIPPTQNTDGSTLGNLAGYRIYYGTQQGALTKSIQVTNPGLTSYTVGNLGAGTYYFSIAAYTADGQESEEAPVGSKTI
jgi:putative Ig domain-containing protein